MQHLGMSRISHAQESPGRRTEDRLITNTTLRNRFTNAPTTTRRIRQQRGAGGIPVSVQTIRNRLHAAGIKSRVPAKKPCLSQRHRAARLQFARNHDRWNRQQWRTVTFSDDSRFCLDTLTGGYVSGVETGNVTQKSTCSHAMRIMEEASWSGQV